MQLPLLEALDELVTARDDTLISGKAILYGLHLTFTIIQSMF